MSDRELLKKVLNECATDGNLYHISPNLFGEISSYLERPEPEPVLWATTDVLAPKDLPMSIRGQTPKTSLGKNERYRIPLYAEPPQRKRLSDDEFLQWLLTHKNDTYALNYATVDAYPVGKRWKLIGWVKKLKAVIEEFYGINASIVQNNHDANNEGK